MRIGDVSKQLDMPSSTIRYYEKRGLLPSLARVSGRREFDASALACLRFIQLCQKAGFSINEISELLLQFAEDASMEGVCKPTVISKREAVRKQIDELKKIDAVLGEMMKCRCTTMQQCVEHALD